MKLGNGELGPGDYEVTLVIELFVQGTGGEGQKDCIGDTNLIRLTSEELKMLLIITLTTFFSVSTRLTTTPFKHKRLE